MDIIPIFSQGLQSTFGLTGAVHIQDAHSGLLHAAGLGGDDAVDGIFDHAFDTVGGRGAGGGSDEHLLALTRGHHPAHGGNTDGERIVHGDSSVHFLVGQHFFHLLVAFFVVSHFHSDDAFGFQRADVIHIDALFGSHQGGLHGVFFAMLTAHTGESYLGALAEAAGLQALGDLHEGIGNGLFNKLRHVSTPLIRRQRQPSESQRIPS